MSNEKGATVSVDELRTAVDGLMGQVADEAGIQFGLRSLLHVAVDYLQAPAR